MNKKMLLLLLCYCSLFAEQIVLVTPRGGEKYLVGQQVLIQWQPADTTMNMLAMVTVLRGGSPVFKDTSNTGLLTWQIPLAAVSGSDYTVKVNELANSLNFDQSDSSFTIEEGDITDTADSINADITEDCLWDADTVYVLQSIAVAAGVNLTVKSGCVVKFYDGCMLTVAGTLNAAGTSAGNIKFTAQNPAFPWGGIYFPEREQIDSSFFTNCHFSYSQAAAGDSGGSIQNNGGVIRAAKGNAITIIDCEFEEDEAEEKGGAIYVNEAILNVTNSIFHHNKAGCYGGAISAENCYPRLNNNTLVYNQALLGGGALAFLNSDAILNNNIFWFNSAADGRQVYLNDGNSDPDFYNCNIEGGLADFGGVGSGAEFSGVYQENLDVNPQIVCNKGEYTYHLLSNSPCIDNGLNGYYGFPQYDIYGNPRTSGSCPDIGAFEYYQLDDIVDVVNAPDQLRLFGYPNPFNCTARINFSLTATSEIRLDLFNSSGQLVRQLAQGRIPAGNYGLNINAAELNSGIYYCRLIDGMRQESIKMILVK